MLEAHGLGHRYGGGDWLFRNLDLVVAPGSVVSVLGPNARGKTTLLTCLAGTRAPAEGEVVAHGRVGYVPQLGAADHAFSVVDMVVMGRARQIRAWSAPSRDDMAAAMAALERVGIAELAGRGFSRLSGGQRQLVLIARALVSGPATLVLDEPASALDLRNQRRVLSVVAELANDGMGVLMTTHDPAHAVQVSTHALLMTDGGKLSAGPAADTLSAGALSDLYRTPVARLTIDGPTGPRSVVVPDLSPIRDDLLTRD